jgi:hypothetical protein
MLPYCLPTALSLLCCFSPKSSRLVKFRVVSSHAATLVRSSDKRLPNQVRDFSPTFASTTLQLASRPSETTLNNTLASIILTTDIQLRGHALCNMAKSGSATSKVHRRLSTPSRLAIPVHCAVQPSDARCCPKTLIDFSVHPIWNYHV